MVIIFDKQYNQEAIIMSISLLLLLLPFCVKLFPPFLSSRTPSAHVSSSMPCYKRHNHTKTIQNYGFTNFSDHVFRQQMVTQETLNRALANTSRI